MRPKTASKWIIGVSGIMLTTYFIGQIQEDRSTDWNKSNSTQQVISAEDYKNLSEREKELVSLDWEEFQTMKETQSKLSNTDTRSRRS